MIDLLTLIQRLYSSEINAGVQAEYPAGFDVWLGDPVKGYSTVRNFGPDQLPEAARWLHAEACRIYPKSAYARSAIRVRLDAIESAEAPT